MDVKTLIRRILLEEDDTAGLPADVRQDVRARQDESERLIGWVQLSLVVLFGGLYLIAPKTHMDSFFHSPVPAALGLYLLFTLTRLALSYRTSLPDWYLGLSGLADIGLLMTLIWSFHIQYDQPPPFYLKAPTMLYVFIFIALRALRFEPRYVLRTGLAAAAGWTALVIYAVYSGDGSMPITRDYVAYLTDNLVLLGGEFDKILTILVVTGLLTLAQMRGRRLLVAAHTDSHAHRELSRFFAPEVAKRIASGDSAPADEVTATVLYIDIRDFTALSERESPVGLIALLSEYQSRMVPLIAAHGGTVERFTGDGVMASFGAAKPNEDYARAALETAAAILEEADSWAAERVRAGQDPVEIGLALTTGRLIVGAVGGGGKFEYTMVGEPANRAAKLEKQNKVMATRALCDRATLDAARAQGWRGAVTADYRAVTVIGLDRPADIAVLD